MLMISGDERGLGYNPQFFDGVQYAKTLPGVTPPLGFFDPLGCCSSENITEGKIKFYREVELKHGRVSMLASFGFVFAEFFHPFFGGKINVPSVVAFQATPLQKFWPWVLLPIGIIEVLSIFTFESPAGGQLWAIRSDYESGDLGFDPLGLKPRDPYEYRVMQDKELNNGRLAMIGIAGMVAQELATGKKLFALAVSGTEAEPQCPEEPAEEAAAPEALSFSAPSVASRRSSHIVMQN